MNKRLFEMTAAACAAFALCLALNMRASAQSAAPGEHDAEILGVRVGMDVPTALEAVFVNAKRRPGEERPDAKRAEGSDVRVVYKKLPQGELQIVFAEGKWVKEITLAYAAKPGFEDLHLAPTGSIAAVGTKDNLDSHMQAGARYDDRYTIGYTSDRKLERFWWRDDKTDAGYRVRVGFVSERLASDGALANKTIARKIVSVTPGDEGKFKSAMSSR
ncbi:MAG TPA: hypothetical protein VM936_07490 [Pyrinomonadaceae bacterium]|jgi:hypothetical protein|nr:hypothetical protein [Pyrinomonadaceae bacterium]